MIPVLYAFAPMLAILVGVPVGVRLYRWFYWWLFRNAWFPGRRRWLPWIAAGLPMSVCFLVICLMLYLGA